MQCNSHTYETMLAVGLIEFVYFPAARPIPTISLAISLIFGAFRWCPWWPVAAPTGKTYKDVFAVALIDSFYLFPFCSKGGAVQIATLSALIITVYRQCRLLPNVAEYVGKASILTTILSDVV
jgi:hypothetical protein